MNHNISKGNLNIRKKIKNSQDDWIPNQERTTESTSSELTEYGGDLKEISTIGSSKKINNKRRENGKDR